MECLTEFTCSVYVDGELPADESRNAEEHLEVCPACRKRVAELQEESRIWIASIQEIDMAPPVPVVVPAAPQTARPADIVKYGGMLVGVTALLRLAMSSPENFVLPSVPMNLDWIDPSSIYGRLSWLGSALVMFAEEGVNGVLALMNSLSTAMILAAVLAGAGLLVRRSLGKGAMATFLAGFAAVTFMVAVLPASSYAVEVRGMDPDARNKVTLIPEGQVIDDSLIAFGDSVVIDGTVTGDVLAFARQVTIHGTVNGSVISGAQNVDIQGTVGGTAIAFGSTIHFSGKIAHNAVGFGQSVSLGKEGMVDGDFGGFSNDLQVNGSVAHNFYGFGLANIAGTIGRNAVFRGATLTVLPSARIGGDLTSYVQKPEMVHVDAGAVIAGKQHVEITKSEPKRRSLAGTIFGEALHVVAAFATGILFLLLFPAARRVAFSGAPTILISAGVGFLLVVAMPIASLILLVTLVGIPISLILFMTWIVGLYLAKIVVANFVGRTLVARDGNRFSTVALGLIVGLALVFIAINLPYIGGLIHFILVLVGFGGLVSSIYRSFQTQPNAVVQS